MPKIRSIADIGKKWKDVTPMRATEYAFGVNNPLEDWGVNTLKAEPTYEAGIRESLTRKAFGKGVTKAGKAKWQRKTIELGVDRWGPGVAAAAGDFMAGFAPYREIIASIVLPEKFAKGDPRNYKRVQAIGDALHKKKIS